MSDILDSYISKIDSGKFVKKINASILKLKAQKDRVLTLSQIFFAPFVLTHP